MKIRRTARTPERPVRSRGGWRKGLVALAALLPVMSILVVTGPARASDSSAPQHQKIPFCHATSSDTNPYRLIDTDDDSKVKKGHGDHTGPIWNPTLNAPDKWGDIIPAFDYYDDDGDLQHFDGLNYNAEGKQVLADGCTFQIAVPVKPVPTPPTCSADGSLTLHDGENYTWTSVDDVQITKPPAQLTVGTHTVTASANIGFFFTNGKKTVSYDVVVEGATNDCKVTLVAPTVTQPKCTEQGTSSPGSFTLPADTADVTYSRDGMVVTATTHVPNKFSATDGWDIAANGLSATYTVTYVPAGDCLTEVIPVAPDVTPSICTGPGTHSDPVITPADTVGITYSVDGTVVTATPNTGYELGTAAGWTAGPNGTATYTVTFTDPGSCLTTVTPAAPSVQQAVCNGPGTSTTPVITPATTEHITYAVNGNVVTATPDKGYVLAKTNGWTIDAETGVGSHTVTLDTLDCTVVVTVVDPTITTAEQCGVASTFTVPETTGISYLVDGEPIAAGTYTSPTTGTITAQAEKGYALGNSEWSFTLDLPATVACPTVVTPVDPTVDPSGECGAEGTYVIASTEGIDYLLDGTVVAAGHNDGPASGTVTARAQEGFTLADAAWSYALDLPAAETCSLANTGGKLPQTGAQTGEIVGAGAVALLAGLVLAVVGRRRPGAIG